MEGAQHGAKSLAEFLDYAKKSGATGAQPSNFMLQDGKKFKGAQEIKDTFAQRGMSLDGIPIGLQLVGRAGGEADLLQLGHAYEQATPWHAMHPPLDAAAALG